MPESKDNHLHTDTRVDTLTGTDTLEIRVPGLTTLWHPNPKRIGERAPLPGLTAGQEAYLSRHQPHFGQPDITKLRPLGDPHISRSPIHFVPGPEGQVTIACHDSPTRIVVDGEPIFTERTLSREEVTKGVVLLLANRIVLLLHGLEPFLSHRVPRYGMVGANTAVVQVRRDVEQVSDLDVPVLIRGATGTGKELVAQAIHEASSRRGPFVAINMGAVPATLAAAELFGARKGAFTGADADRDGYFAQAEGGTLFLDEIGETPPEIQVMLLRALETRTIQAVGSSGHVEVDVRLVAATDADLEAAVEEQRFRAPLLHRLSGFEIRLPPLLERRDDFGRLFLHFLRLELERVDEAERLETPTKGRPFVAAELVARLAAFRWPGNVRQLQNVVRQMVIASRGHATLRPGSQVEQMLREVARKPRRRRPLVSKGSESTVAEITASDLEDRERTLPPPRPTYRSPATIREDELLEALRANRWRLQPTARQLGVSRTSLYELVDKSPHVRKAGDLEREEIEQALAGCDGDPDAVVDKLQVSQKGLLRRMSRLGLR